MLYLSLAAVVIAALAWDGWRRMLRVEANRQTDVQTRMEELEKGFTDVQARMDRAENAVANGVRETRQLITPVRAQLIEAQQRKARS